MRQMSLKIFQVWDICLLSLFIMRAASREDEGEGGGRGIVSCVCMQGERYQKRKLHVQLHQVQSVLAIPPPSLPALARPLHITTSE